MSRLESAELTEQIVGAKRNAVNHLGRAVSAEQRVYILHSEECKVSQPDLRKCEFSIALDRGIDLEVWGHFQDEAVVLSVSPGGDLLPGSSSHRPIVASRKNAVYICGGDDRPGPREECPNSLHDWPLPAGYGDATAAASSRLSRGWVNKRCPDCQLYGWVPGRLKGEAPTRVESHDSGEPTS